MANDRRALAIAFGLIGLIARAMGSTCTDTAPADMVWVGGGQFTMGGDLVAAAATAPPVVAVHGFWLGRHEVSNQQFARFAAAAGYVTAAERTGADQQTRGSFVFRQLQRLKLDSTWWRLERSANWRQPQGTGSDWSAIPDHPVVHVTLADALAYAHWAGGALPTEAQWEYAARIGRRGTSHHAANTWQGEFPLHDSAADGHAGTAPVGSYPPDELGLYDMLGNVWELTRSVDASGQRALIKGGSFLCNARYCNSARPEARQWQDMDASAAHVGFRLASLRCR
jgi:formylglycine-generating enzyme required for sulfatase activity